MREEKSFVFISDATTNSSIFFLPLFCTLLINKLSCRCEYPKKLLTGGKKMWKTFPLPRLGDEKLSSNEEKFIHATLTERHTLHHVLGSFVYYPFIPVFSSLKVINFILFLLSSLSQSWKAFQRPMQLAIRFGLILAYDWDTEIWWNAIISQAQAEDYFMNEAESGEFHQLNSPTVECACATGIFQRLRCTSGFPDSACFMYSDAFLCARTLVMYWF